MILFTQTNISLIKDDSNVLMYNDGCFKMLKYKEFTEKYGISFTSNTRGNITQIMISGDKYVVKQKSVKSFEIKEYNIKATPKYIIYNSRIYSSYYDIDNIDELRYEFYLDKNNEPFVRIYFSYYKRCSIIDMYIKTGKLKNRNGFVFRELNKREKRELLLGKVREI